MALPVVCTDADGLVENVADGRTGFVVPRRSPEALAIKLELLAADGNLRRRLGDAARQRAVACFPLRHQIDAFERLYSAVTAGVETGARKAPDAGHSAWTLKALVKRPLPKN